MEYNIEKLLKIVESYNPDELKKVKFAYEIANKFHMHQYRKSGEPYIIHPLAVATMLANMHADGATLCAALLHDLVEDTTMTYHALEKLFGKTIVSLVEGVTKISKITTHQKVKLEVLNNAKLIRSVNYDIRIIILKLVDRLHNMQTLDALPDFKQKRIALQTMEVYAPLAYYIGAYNLKRKLEDLSFKYLESNQYDEITSKLDNQEKSIKTSLFSYIVEFKKLLLEKAGIDCEIELRTKNKYRIFLKLEEGIPYEEIHDIYSFKIITETEDDCYKILEIIKNTYESHDGIVNDYIVNTKDNNYRAIHTKVKYENKVIQFKILTKDMQYISTYGLIGYWKKYEGLAPDKMLEKMQKSEFFKSLKLISEEQSNLENKNSDSEKFMERVKSELLTRKNIHNS